MKPSRPGRVLQERRGELRLSREGVSRLTGVEPARLRAVEGLTLEEIAVRHGLHRERVRQILRAHFRLGEPWAANARRNARAKARRGRGQ